jgi:formylglycine-generating enzyme required for sulfatase activity
LKARILEARDRAFGAAGAEGVTRLAQAVRPPLAPFPARTAEVGRNFTTLTAGVPMVWIAPGTFLMSNPQGSDDDTRVTLSRGYWLGRTEVTQAQWQSVMENLPRPSLFRGSDRPVERVPWVSAMEFCRKLDEQERAAGRLPDNYEYSLPTEAQWEYACRAGTTGSFAGELETLAWLRVNSEAQSHPVAQKQPNAWGLYDMHGNVWEWCVDGYQGYPGGAVTDWRGDYLAPSAATFRIVRGGSWSSTAGECRSGYRAWDPLNSRNGAVGFRLALVPRGNSTEPAKPVR